MRIDLHTHIVPPRWEDFAARYGGGKWPRLVPRDACRGTLMTGDQFFRDVDDRSWSAARRLEDMDRLGIDRQALSPPPVMFCYWAEPEATRAFARMQNEQVASVAAELFGDSVQPEQVIGETLKALFAQRLRDFELINVDSGSTDGTVAIIRQFNPDPIQIPASTYKPGRALNMGIEASQGDLLVFLNSDATPVGAQWLEALIAPLAEPRFVATFGRQLAREDARPAVRRDYERAFGNGSISRRWFHFFSLANSAIRRSAWEMHRFSEELQYSEDTEWSSWARSSGYLLRYVPEACVLHSHNYTLRQTWRRFAGEGEADARIFPWSAWRGSLLRYAVIPYLADVARDTAYCLPRGEVRGILEAPIYRAVEKWARYRGFRKGKVECKDDRR